LEYGNMGLVKTTFEMPDEDGLRAGVGQNGTPRGQFRLKDGSFGGDRRSKELSWPAVRSIIYEGRGE
jgi:hypothetical protein